MKTHVMLPFLMSCSQQSVQLEWPHFVRIRGLKPGSLMEKFSLQTLQMVDLFDDNEAIFNQRHNKTRQPSLTLTLSSSAQHVFYERVVPWQITNTANYHQASHQPVAAAMAMKILPNSKAV
jgi:hypothetical protein